LDIRPVRLEDAAGISRIRREDGVREEVFALSSERLSVTLDFLNSLTNEDRVFVAVENNELIGMAALLKNRCHKRSHCGSVTTMVDKDFQGRGIGKALMTRIIDEADNALKLRRSELLVLTDNAPAIQLYKKFGFKIEATRKRAAVKDGKFVDEYFLARINRKGDPR